MSRRASFTVLVVLVPEITLVGLGGLMWAFSRPLANVTFQVRDRRIASSTYLSADTVAERREAMRSRENRRFDVARVRVVGGLLCLSGVIGILRSIGI